MAESSDESGARPAPRVGVVTVAYRSNAVLEKLLASLADASTEPLSVVVVDNFPGDDESASPIAHRFGATYVARPENPGYGAAINAGQPFLPQSVEWVLICNPDLELAPGSIDALLATAETDARIASVGPAILNIDGSVYPSARRVPSLRTGVGHALFANIWQSNPWTKAYKQDSTDALTRRDAGWLSGACLLVRRAAFTDTGGFDEGYFMYFEDVDLGYRFGKAGWRNVFEPSARATHIGGHSTAGSSARMVRAHHDSARQFVNRKYTGGQWWPVRTVLNIGLSVRSRVQVRAVEKGARRGS
ncbi:glycosyltransferase family 2 protein [Microcella alkaliphila]|uniref:N-acetylglucosaminyl-diphospho-decaprenol L-rhamnosyltransferase n=1 Tax=Microcella alkaliphila TaxID=279828 RepID=A0A0U5CHE8_9MICO|nr:glycosyltransferase family 2 protein [Microcella alkaliphila]BAU33122.1 putative uncharacterized protein [Microcella alkaliphila]